MKKLRTSEVFRPSQIGKRALIVFGGVLSFWIMAAILFGIVFGLGTQVAISDTDNHNLIDPKVQIAALSADSPAEKAGIKAGDTILKIRNQKSEIKNSKSKRSARIY